MGSRRKRSPAVDCAGAPGSRLVAQTAQSATQQCVGTGHACGVAGEWVFRFVWGHVRRVVDRGDAVGCPDASLADCGGVSRQCGCGALGRVDGGGEQ